MTGSLPPGVRLGPPLDMKPEIREAWATALESGEYAQCPESLSCDLAVEAEAREDLHDPRWVVALESYRDGFTRGHCCLGVLTDLAVQAGVVNWDELESDTVLDFRVVEWAGLRRDDPVLTGKLTATVVNDDLRWTFPHIARVIRGQEEGCE